MTKILKRLPDERSKPRRRLSPSQALSGSPIHEEEVLLHEDKDILTWLLDVPEPQVLNEVSVRARKPTWKISATRQEASTSTRIPCPIITPSNKLEGQSLPFAEVAKTFMEMLLSGEQSTWHDYGQNPIPCSLCVEDDTMEEEKKTIMWKNKYKLLRHMNIVS